MIVGGTSHSGRGLGKYLTEEDNDRAIVWDIRGSVFSELTEAVKDWRTDRLGTKTEKPLYHAWIAPSDTDRALTREEWDKAIALFEKEMGLEGQPRAVVYHEGQEGRETGHIHLVYSRIQDGKAISDSWDYLHHQKARVQMEKAFALDHVYAPLLDKDEPRRAQSIDEDAKEQGKRTKIDPHIVKAEVAEIYRRADSGRAFVAGIEEAGYILAQGKQRAYIIVDQAGGAHSLSRILNGTAKAEEFRDRLKEYQPNTLPDDKAAREIQHDRAQGRTTARDEIAYEDSLAAAAIEKERREGQFTGAVATKAQGEKQTRAAAEKELDKTAGNIRLSYALTNTPQEFTAALAERGLILARVTEAEAYQSERNNALAKELGRFAPTYRENEAVVINPQGQIYKLDSRSTGESRAEVEKYLGTLDRSSLPTLEQVRAAQIDHAATHAEKIIQEVSKNRAVFDEREITQALFKHNLTPEARETILAHESVIRLEGENGKPLFTTAATRANEQAALDLARSIQGQAPIPAASLENTLKRYEEAGRPLDAEQEKALRQALDNRFSVIQGRAGTGKSFTLNALRETLEGEGYQVTGLAPTNTAAKDLREAGFQNARTLHSFIHTHQQANEEGRPLDTRARVLIVDEAAMIDTQRTKELLQAAQQLNARVVFAGDERQLASIEAGGMFGVFAKAFGEAELSTVHRQREHWQKDASRAFARGDTAAGMQAYADHGAITWSDKRDEAAAQLVQAWVKERDQAQNGEAQDKTAFVFAHSNASVDGLNAALQAEQIKAGLVQNLQPFTTPRGEILVGEGDRLQFRANDKPNGVFNGSLGTVEKIDGDTITVRLDAGGAYSLDTASYTDFQLGYAGTVYRGQGKTIDNAFVLYSAGMDKQAAYVAMTRARDETKVFVAREEAPDLDGLISNIDRRQHYGASLNYEATGESPALPPPAQEQAKAAPEIDQAPRVAVSESGSREENKGVETGHAPASGEGMDWGADAINGLTALADGVADAIGGLFWGLAGGDPKPPPTPEQKAEMDKAAEREARVRAFRARQEEYRRENEREREAGLEQGKGLGLRLTRK